MASIVHKGDSQNARHLQIQGVVDFTTASQLLKASHQWLKSQQLTIEWDWSQVERVNSVALSLMLEWQRIATKKRLSMTFVRLPSNLYQLTSQLGLNLILPINKE